MYLTYNTPSKLIITITDMVSRNEKSFSDITDVLFFLKKDASDLDEDACMTASIGTGITLNDPTIDIAITDANYALVRPGKTYLFCLGVEFNSSGIYIEDYDPLLERKIKILEDKIRA